MFGGSFVTLVVAFGLLQWRIQDFPEEGAPTFGGGATCNFAKCSKKKKLHEIERIWTRGEERIPHAPLDTPLFCPEILGNGGDL